MAFYYIPPGAAPGMTGFGQIPGWGDLPGGCPEGQIYDPSTGGCIPVWTPGTCPEGQILDPTTGQCVPMYSVCPEGQIYNPLTGGCEPIPGELPDVPIPPQPEPPGPDVGTCPPGAVMNENGQCVCPPGTEMIMGVCTSSQMPTPPLPCPPGQVLDPEAGCVPETPLAEPPLVGERPGLLVPIVVGVVGVGILVWIMKG
jgi:hypothetical protein